MIELLLMRLGYLTVFGAMIAVAIALLDVPGTWWGHALTWMSAWVALALALVATEITYEWLDRAA